MSGWTGAAVFRRSELVGKVDFLAVPRRPVIRVVGGEAMMEIWVKGNDIPQTVLAEIGRVADHARLQTDGVRHDTVAATVTISLERLPVTGKSFFGTTHHAGAPVRTSVTIRNVTDCRIDRLSEERLTVTIIFGLKVEQNTVFMCSAEEDKGQPLFSMDCRVSELDIEIKDE